MSATCGFGASFGLGPGSMEETEKGDDNCAIVKRARAWFLVIHPWVGYGEERAPSERGSFEPRAKPQFAAFEINDIPFDVPRFGDQQDNRVGVRGALEGPAVPSRKSCGATVR